MGRSPTTLLQEVLALPEERRIEMAGALMESLEPGAESESVAAEWKLEVARRLAELDAGTVETIPWETVRERLYSRLRERRPS